MDRPDRPAGTLPAGPGAIIAILGLAAASAAAFLLAPDWNAATSPPKDGPVQIGAPQAHSDAAAARALSLARGADRLGAKLFDAVRFRVPADGRGLLIAATADANLLDRAGLKTGDILVESDDRPIDAAGPAMLKEQWGSLDAVEVVVQRDGQLRQLTIDLTRQPSSSSSS